MSFKGNISPTGRDFFFNPAGDNAFKGSSLELSVEDPQTAISRVNALIPPPSSSDPASINASVTGNYPSGIVIPDFTKCNAESASIATFDAIAVECGNRQSISWSTVINLANNGVCIDIDSLIRVNVTANAVVVGGDDGVGIAVSGVCEEIFCNIKEGLVNGDRGMMLDHTANSAVPIQYVADVILFTGDDQIILRYNDPVGTTESIFNVSAIQPQGSPTNSKILELIAGLVVIDAEVLVADTIAVVKSGAQLGLDCIAASGDTIIEAGGLASYKSIGQLTGNVDVSGGMALTTNSLIGDFTVTGTGNALVNIGTMAGDFTVDSGGILDVIVLTHTGTVSPSDPGAGPINGIIDNKRYGERRVLDVVVLSGADTTIQTPTGLGAPLKITFGAAQVNAEVSIDALGDITINVTNEYFFRFEYQPARINNGGVAELYFRVLVDGVQTGQSIKTSLDGMNDDWPVVVSTPPLDLISGQVVTAEMVRSITGSNDGALFPNAPVQAGWTDAPSALVTVTRRT